MSPSRLEKKCDNASFSFLVEEIQGDFLSDVIHKIKNGLGGIGGFASLLERDMEENDPRFRMVYKIQDGVSRVNEIAVGLMVLVREIIPSFECIHLRSFIADIVRNIIGDENISTDEILGKGFDSEKNKMFLVDSQIIDKMMTNIILFIRSINCKIRTIELDSCSDNRLIIKLLFSGDTSFIYYSDNLVEYIRGCEPVESRLFLAVALKMARLHGGDISLLPLSNSNRILKIQINTGAI